MTNPPTDLRTERLLLRRWKEQDRVAFAKLNADQVVMRFFPALLTRAESDALADRIEAHFQEHGFGLWAVEIPGLVAFAGYVGLSVPRFQAHFTPLRRDRLASGCSVLESRLRYRRSACRAGIRF